MIQQDQKSSPQISIGLPVYNGQQFIKKKLDSILAQSYPYFELIISDNASTDLTPKICEEYAKNDKRIRYIRQQKNMGATWNFNFVLQQSKNDYFMWTAVDDLILPEFLEKNVNVLEKNKKLVGSISKVETYLLDKDIHKKNSTGNYREFRKKLIRRFRPSGAHSLSGSYENKVREFLKKSAYQIIYGLFRTEVLKKSMVSESFVGNDGAIVLNVLKHGDMHLIDEVLMQRYDYGFSTKGSISNVRQLNKGLLGMIFPHYPLTAWFVKNLGFKLYLKNLDHFIKLNLAGEIFLIIEAILSTRKLLKRT